MHIRTKAWLLATGAAVAFAAPAYAADGAEGASAASADTAQGEVIITAQKREERLLDVPQSVSVLSGQDLQAVHAQRFADYLTRLPSANVVEGQAGNTRLVLRGVNTGGVGATVATYVDETPYGSATGLANGSILTPDIDPFDVQRIEVLRGPQGTLYGANSLGGLVKYVTIAPQTDAFHFSGEAGIEDVEHGNTGWSGRAAINLPVSQDMAIRASGFYRKDPGYIDDPRLGSDINDGKTYGGRASVLVRPTSNLTLRGTVFLENLNSNGTNEEDVDPATLKPVLGRLTQSRVVPQPNDMKYRIYNGTANYDLGSVSLVSSTSFGTLEEAQIEDITGLYGALLTGAFGQPLGSFIENNIHQKRFTQEVRLSSSGKHMVDWTIGGFYTHEHNKIDQVLVAIDPSTGAVLPALSPLEIAAVHSKYSEYAGFANATVHFSPRFDLTFGGRYSHNRQRNLTSTSGPLAGGGNNLDGTSNDNVFTYSVAPAFHPTDRMTIYARVARGYQPGGPNALPPLAPDTVPRYFGSSTTMNYEAGIKSELIDRMLSLEVTAFQIDWKDIQVLASVNGYGVNTNGGKARSKGIELSATLTPMTGLSLSANGAYIDAKLTEDTPDVVGGLRGDQLPYNPHFAGTLAVDYSRPLSGNVDGTIGASWRHTGARKGGFDTTFHQLSLNAMDQLDAHAGVSFGAYRIDAFVRNLTDSRGISNIGGAGTALNGAIAAAVIRPRSIGVSFGVRY